MVNPIKESHSCAVVKVADLLATTELPRVEGKRQKRAKVPIGTLASAILVLVGTNKNLRSL